MTDHAGSRDLVEHLTIFIQDLKHIRPTTPSRKLYHNMHYVSSFLQRSVFHIVVHVTAREKFIWICETRYHNTLVFRE